MSVDEELLQRLRRLEDRAEIGELVARYCFAIDDRDVAAIADCFTADGRFRSLDGVLDAQGREAVVRQFHARFAVLGATYHYTHDRVLDFDPLDRAAAHGVVAAHAEVVRHGEPMWVALRYADRYRREDGRWRFADRELSFMYYLRVDEYVEALRGRERMRAYERAAPADWPEGSAGWRRYAPPPA
jgi:uncharacterized protein (TIGR02246 family)